jgi:hypothetical protein
MGQNKNTIENKQERERERERGDMTPIYFNFLFTHKNNT